MAASPPLVLRKTPTYICLGNPKTCLAVCLTPPDDDEDADLAAAIAASMEQHPGPPAAAAGAGDGSGSSYAAVAAGARQQQQWGSAGDLAGAALLVSCLHACLPAVLLVPPCLYCAYALSTAYTHIPAGIVFVTHVCWGPCTAPGCCCRCCFGWRCCSSCRQQWWRRGRLPG